MKTERRTCYGPTGKVITTIEVIRKQDHENEEKIVQDLQEDLETI